MGMLCAIITSENSLVILGNYCIVYIDERLWCLVLDGCFDEKIWLFDVSCGFHDIGQWGRYQIDHSNKVSRIPVATST